MGNERVSGIRNDIHKKTILLIKPTQTHKRNKSETIISSKNRLLLSNFCLEVVYGFFINYLIQYKKIYPTNFLINCPTYNGEIKKKKNYFILDVLHSW